MNDHQFLPAIHPGEILKSEFLQPLGISPEQLSVATGISFLQISELLAGQGQITADTALRLGRHLGMSAQFWINLQSECDLRQAQGRNADHYARIEPIHGG